MRTLFTILIIVFTTSCKERNHFSKQQDQNQKIVEQYFKYFNNHNWQKMPEMYLKTAEFKDPPLGDGIVKMTTAEIVAKYSKLNGIFSDIQDIVIQTYSSGGRKIIKDFSYFDNFEE